MPKIRYFISPGSVGFKLEDYMNWLNNGVEWQDAVGRYASQIQALIKSGILAGSIIIRRPPSYGPVFPSGDIPSSYKFDPTDVIEWAEIKSWLGSKIGSELPDVPPWVEVKLDQKQAISYDWFAIKPTITPPEPSTADAKGATAETTKDNTPPELPWKETARSIGIEIAEKKTLLSVQQIAGLVHKELVKRHQAGDHTGCGRGDKVPMADTIKRHALTGIKAEVRDH